MSGLKKEGKEACLISGDLILIAVKGTDRRKIYFWNHEMEMEEPDYSSLTLIADTFSEFINSLYEFDESTLPVG